MENDVAPATSPAKEFLPLLEAKLKKLFQQREQISEEIEETCRMIDEFKVKLAGGELPLPIGESIIRETAVEFARQESTSY
jgi:hypothetical protein